jgi:integrase
MPTISFPVVDRNHRSTTSEQIMTNKVKLTKRTVEALPVEKGRREVRWDTEVSGFGVRATGAGRTYFIRYRVGSGRTAPRKDYTIGRHGAPWTVEQARTEATVILGKVNSGQDPQAEKVSKRKPDTERSFEHVAGKFIERHVDRNLRPSTVRDYRNVINKTLVPEWTGKHVADISRADVRDLIDGIEDRAPVMARLVFAVARKLFAFAVERDYLSDNPCIGLSAPPAPKARERILTDAELLLVWKASADLPFPYDLAIRALILTAQRRSEVSAMRMEELDFNRAEWIIPGEKAKNGKAHVVDLSPEALTVLAEAIADPDDPTEDRPREGSYIFGVTGANPPGQWGKMKSKLDALVAELARKDEAEPPAPWRIHDMRRTAASGMAALGYGPQVIERVINHTSGATGGLVGVYQRFDYRGERKAALEAWGRHVAALVKPTLGNVVEMKFGAS